jgi:hypothetical protein
VNATTTHSYTRDPQSGAGNCTCGASESHRRHPHQFRRVSPMTALNAILNAGTLDVCVCGLLAEAEQHFDSLKSQGSKS